MDLSEYILEPLRKDEELTLYRGQHRNPDRTTRTPILLVAPMLPHPAPSSLRREDHKNSLRSELETAWDATPIEVVQYDGQPALVLENPGRELFDALVRRPPTAEQFLRIALEKAFEEIK